MTSKYLVYGLVDPRTEQLRYVGKTRSGISRARGHFTYQRCLAEKNHKANWIRELKSLGLEPRIYVIQSFDDAEILSQAEIYWIAYFKALGFPLTNLTIGGEGGSTCAGRPKTEAHKLAISKARKGQKVPAYEIERRRIRMKGNTFWKQSKRISLAFRMEA